MQVDKLVKMTQRLGISFYTGVPDSLLNPLCEYLQDTVSTSNEHIIAANEGAAVSLAAGHYLATGKPALVYMQNSGLGNAVNPICSLLSERVYAIPALFVIGWRGEPGVKDEPQHVFQGEITLKLLDCLDIDYIVISEESDSTALEKAYTDCVKNFNTGRSFALVIKKGALTYNSSKKTENKFSMSRERALEIILEMAEPETIFVSTTGKLSREVYEIREKKRQGHQQDFLTVGSMGHSISIALGIALAKPDKQIWCLDGDGSMLMHMGSSAVTGLTRCKNLHHFVINNGAHESVGGMPTAASSDIISLTGTASSCGLNITKPVQDEASLTNAIHEHLNCDGPLFTEILTNLQVRKDLGRPVTSPTDNRNAFMKHIQGEK